MAQLIVNGDTIRCRVICYTPSQISVNLLHYKCTNLVGAPTDQDIVDSVATGWGIAYKPALGTASRYRGVGLQIVTGGARLEVVNIASDGQGTGNVGVGPTQTSAVLKKKGALATRKNRGRLYFPFPAVNDFNVDGSMVGAYKTLMTTVATAFGPQLLGIGTGGRTVTLDMVLATYIGSPPILTSTLNVLTFAPTGLWGTQRRRSEYGKHNTLPF